MNQNAPAPKAKSPPMERKHRRWPPLLAGFIAIGLIAFGASKGIGACTDDPDYRGCVRGHLQHAFAILGTVTAALASVTQGRTAKTKSDYHGEKWSPVNDTEPNKAHADDFHHFRMVSFWWYTFFVGALAAVVAEFIDWWGKPFIDSLLKLI
jgi:hypothetical protein